MWITFCFGKNNVENSVKIFEKGAWMSPERQNTGGFSRILPSKSEMFKKNQTNIHIFQKNRQTNVDNIFFNFSNLNNYFLPFSPPHEK